MVHPLIVVGAGPAGLSAALYARRAGVSTLVLERGLAGGQLLMTGAVENYPGAGAVTGAGLADAFARQAKDAGVEIEDRISVEWIEIENGIKILKTDKGERRARALIIATGSTPRRLDVPGEKQLTGKGVSYCALCDAPFFKGKRVAVAGGGDSAAGESLFLAEYASRVTILSHKGSLKAEWTLQERLKSSPSIDVIHDVEIRGIAGENKVESVSLQNIKTGERSDLQTDGIFIFIGSIPQTGFLKGLNILDREQLIPTDEFTRTSVPGLFAAGECRAGSLKQIVTSAGEGATSATMAAKYLESARREWK